MISILVLILFYIVPAVVGYYYTRIYYRDHSSVRNLDGVEVFGVLFPVVNLYYVFAIKGMINRAKGAKPFSQKFFRL